MRQVSWIASVRSGSRPVSSRDERGHFGAGGLGRGTGPAARHAVGRRDVNCIAFLIRPESQEAIRGVPVFRTLSLHGKRGRQFVVAVKSSNSPAFRRHDRAHLRTALRDVIHQGVVGTGYSQA